MLRPGQRVPETGYYVLSDTQGNALGEPRFFDQGDRLPPTPKKRQYYRLTKASALDKDDSPSPHLHAQSPVTGRTYPDLIAEIVDQIGNILRPLVLVGAVGGLVWFITERFELQRNKIHETTTATFDINTRLLNQTYENMTEVSGEQIKQLKSVYDIYKQLDTDRKILENETRRLSTITKELEDKNESLRALNAVVTAEARAHDDSMAVLALRQHRDNAIISHELHSGREDIENKLYERAKEIKRLRDSLYSLIEDSQFLVEAIEDRCSIGNFSDNSPECGDFVSIRDSLNEFIAMNPQNDVDIVRGFFDERSLRSSNLLDLLIGRQITEDIIDVLREKSQYARSFDLPEYDLKYYIAAESVTDEFYGDTISMQVSNNGRITDVSTQRKMFKIKMASGMNLFHSLNVLYTVPYITRYYDIEEAALSENTWTLQEHIERNYGGELTEELFVKVGAPEKRVSILSLEEFGSTYTDELRELLKLDGRAGRVSLAGTVRENGEDVAKTLKEVFGAYSRFLSEPKGQVFVKFVEAAMAGNWLAARQLVGSEIGDDRLGYMAAVMLHSGFGVTQVDTISGRDGRSALEIRAENSQVALGGGDLPRYKMSFIWRVESESENDNAWRISFFKERLNEAR